MSITAQAIVDEVRKTLNDKGSTKKWSDSDLTNYLNGALLQLALVRPDATAKTESALLVAGSKQTLPAGGLRLLDVTRNMGTNGTTPGAVVSVADKDSMGLFKSDWHSQAQASEVENYIYDERNPKTYFVSPPVTSSPAVYVEMVYSAIPTAVLSANLAVNIPVDDVYKGPVLDWMLHLSFGVEIISVNSQRLSKEYERSFYQSLGIKYTADIGYSPNVPKPSEAMK